MNKIVGLTLYPTFTYARIYYTGATLRSHIDRPSCEYSTTICIDSTDIWDFYIKDRSGKENIFKLNPGDMCVYSGCELPHWRKPYEGQKQMQCFLHYVNSEGPYKNFKYDKRPMMGIFKPQKNTIKYQ
jgi:alkylated DNA repair dioxygenase AlkB